LNADVIACVDPLSGELLGHVPVVEPDEVASRMAAARAVQPGWARARTSARRRVGKAVLHAVARGQDELCRMASHDTGRSMLEIMVADLVPTCEVLRRATSRFRAPGSPRGVVAIVGAGRAPLLETIAASVPAVVDGNAVAIKLSTHACWSGLAFVEVVRDVLREHRCPADLVQPITGHEDATEALLALADHAIDTARSPTPTTLDGDGDTYALFEAAIRVAYGGGVRRRARALLDMARARAQMP
jgi:acyl-CoA reductase-like NAD-dependent aldehyde dehydrogenase